jgi:large subunit ribosomal protein L24
MAAAKIKKGDQVIVLSGKDKGKTGTVTASMPKDGKVLVGGVNVATRHTKPSQNDPQGGLKRFEAPLHVSKVGQDRGEDRWVITTRPASASSMTRPS